MSKTNKSDQQPTVELGFKSPQKWLSKVLH